MTHVAVKPSAASEKKLDDMIDDSFPASDPPSTTPTDGTRKSQELRPEREHDRGHDVPKASPSDDRHATETAGARQHGTHPAETDDRSGDA